MPLEHPDFLKNSPYYDDFSDEKNFLRVLFKPGYAVQARELTQIQTILQSQISKFADHIFKEGSKVFGGNVNIANLTFVRVEKFLVLPGTTESIATTTTVDSYLNTLKLDDSSLYVSNDQNSSYIGSIQHIELEIYSPDDQGNYDFTEINGSIRLVHFSESGYSDNDDYTILFVEQTSGNEIQSNSILKVKDSEIYLQVIPETKIQNSNINIIEPTGSANLISVDSGIYYTNGIFVNNKRQHFCVYQNSIARETELSLFNGVSYIGAPENVRLFNYISGRIGFTLVKRSITVQEDNTLRDPASGFYNANAPGADRYTIDLVLTSLPYDPSSVDIENYANKDFIQLVRIVKGKIDWVKRLTDYSEILDLFARRTYDESGSYTVYPFAVDVKNHLRKDSFELIVQNSPENTLDDSYLEIGSFVWDSSIPFDPFTNTNYSSLSFPVGKVIQSIPFRENDPNSSNTNVISKKILIQPLNSIRFEFTPGLYQNFKFKKSAISSEQTISATYSKFITDSEGFYSIYDNPTGDNNKLLLSVKPGKAYVYGYEREFYSTNNVEYKKGRDAGDKQTQLSVLSSDQFLGNYVVGNFIQDNSFNLNIDSNIDWEKLPKFELQSDEIFTLIMEKGADIKANANIHSWSSFKITDFNSNERKMFGFEGENANNQEYESVLLIKNNT